MKVEAIQLDLKHLKVLDENCIISITNRAGVIIYANQSFASISKFTCEELIGKPHSIVNSRFHPKEFFKNMWSTILSGKVWTGEVKNIGKYGDFYWTYSVIVPIKDKDDKIEQFISIRQDITKQKEQEEIIDFQRKKIMEAISLKKANHTLDVSIGEINNPISVIKSNAMHLMRKVSVGQIDFVECKTYIENILNTVDRLNKSINLISDLAIESKTDKRTLFLLSDLISQIEFIANDSCHECDVDVKIGKIEEVKIIGNVFQVQFALVNIVDELYENICAIDKPILEIYFEKSEEFVFINFLDKRFPLVYDDLKNEFILNETRKRVLSSGSDTGLGLTRKIIENHQGKLTIENVKNQICYRVSLPYFKITAGI